ncbi:type I-E CRISPR-associated protein Cas5/CasD [Streptomyces griseorubiginosus]|uniref:type I-E CRISPR-associated protein Cas5/CasD n=1 Tax=Streptomyces griseorubiginosus TaxID=67304 RepID=UPI0036B7AFDD
MSGILLRLAGPLASFGTNAAFHDRDTCAHPTRSALIGMFAACAGRDRSHALAPFTDLPGQPRYHDLTFTIRIDRPGTPYTDFHTVGGGYPRDEQLPTSRGPRRPEAASTLVSRRHYLADAVFTVAVTGPTPLLESIAHHLAHPRYAPYLGRRNCVPTEPLVLATGVSDPVGELLGHVPLSLARPPRQDATTVPVIFVWEQPPPCPDAVEYELADVPEDFTQGWRRYQLRSVWRTRQMMPAALYAGPSPWESLAAYMHPEPA